MKKQKFLTSSYGVLLCHQGKFSSWFMKDKYRRKSGLSDDHYHKGQSIYEVKILSILGLVLHIINHVKWKRKYVNNSENVMKQGKTVRNWKNLMIPAWDKPYSTLFSLTGTATDTFIWKHCGAMGQWPVEGSGNVPHVRLMRKNWITCSCLYTWEKKANNKQTNNLP